MPRMSADVRRRELVAAAVRVMAHEGVAAATTRAIADEAKMPLGAFHYCFGSKLELLRELAGVVLAQELAAAAAVMKPGASIDALLRDGFDAYWRYVQSCRETYGVLVDLLQYAARTPGLEDVPRRNLALYVETICKVLRTAATAADVRWSIEVPILARIVGDVLSGVIRDWLVDGDAATGKATYEAFAGWLATLAVPVTPGPADHPGPLPAGLGGPDLDARAAPVPN